MIPIQVDPLSTKKTEVKEKKTDVSNSDIDPDTSHFEWVFYTDVIDDGVWMIEVDELETDKTKPTEHPIYTQTLMMVMNGQLLISI